MSLLGGGTKSFLETNAWQHGNVNSLRYNTSQAGSVIPIIYGTARQQINLIGFGDFRGAAGKKGKNGPLPIGGAPAGKGGAGGGKKGAGGKKNPEISIDVDFAICQGPVDIGNTNKVWASAGIAFFQSVGLNLYTGEDGQAADPVFEGLGQIVGYSGTCHVTGTPMDLGSSPVLPNLSFEVTGFEVGTCGPGFPADANPANVVQDFLTNARYGAGWPSANLDPDIATPSTNNYGDYCQAALFAISPALQGQIEAAAWVSELARLTNTAIVWSGSVLKFLPYGDIELGGNGAVWTPNLIPLYSFTDDDFLPWNPHIDSHDPQLGEDDPVIVTRSNPSDATNWMSIEYLDRANSYNKTVIPQFDQGSIDLYGLRTESSIQGNCFCDKIPASLSLRLLLQRALYVRNTYKFQVGWQYALLEPMDIVLLTDARCGLFEQPVRVTKIEENDNGDLSIDAEEIKVDTPIVTGCAIGRMQWRLSAPNFIDLYFMPPDRLDKFGNYYSGDPYDASVVDNWTIYDTDGMSIATLTYHELWDRIHDYAGIDHDPVLGVDRDDSQEYQQFYGFWPIHNGEYVLTFIQRISGASFAYWWALLDPEDLSVIGAYYYTSFGASFGWPYINGRHVLQPFAKDQPILVQAYAFGGSTKAVIGTLPSIDEFVGGTYTFGFGELGPFKLPNTMLYPIGGDTEESGISDSLLANNQSNNASRNFGFVLPGSNGLPIYYIYLNRQFMDGCVDSPISNPSQLVENVQPSYPNGAMLKIRLTTDPGFSFSGLADTQLLPGIEFYRGAPTDDYSIDNENWIEAGGGPAIPFVDEYTHISDDTAGGRDVYSLQTGTIDRGGGKFWIVFYMVGTDDAAYRNGISEPYEHPIYERVRVFEYDKSSETAREIAKTTCILHEAEDIPAGDGTDTWELSNDNYQIFSVTQVGSVATLYIHGHLFKRPFMTFIAPIDVSPV